MWCVLLNQLINWSTFLSSWLLERRKKFFCDNDWQASKQKLSEWMVSVSVLIVCSLEHSIWYCGFKFPPQSLSLSQMNIAIQSRQVCCVYGTRVHQHTMKWSKVEIALHINFKWHYSYADCRQHSYIIAKSMSISCHLFNNSFYCFP